MKEGQTLIGVLDSYKNEEQLKNKMIVQHDLLHL